MANPRPSSAANLRAVPNERSDAAFESRRETDLEPDRDRTFESIFRQHFDYVWRASRTLVGPSLADDVTQEVFLLVRRKLHAFEGGSMRAWLYGCTRNVARNTLRGRERRARRHKQAPMAVPNDAGANWARAHEAADLMDRFLRRLPLVQREAFVLKEIEELTAAEIGAAVGVPVQTVYSRVRAAKLELGKFRESLRAEEEGRV